MNRSLYLVALILLLACPAPLYADDFRPLYVELTERAEHEFLVRMRLPPRIPTLNQPSLIFPDDCVWMPAGFVECVNDPAGKSLRLVYPRLIPQSITVVRIFFATGEEHTMTLASGELEVPLPDREDVSGVAAQYTWLGIEHIWIGFDHLLFVLCLIWIAGSWQRVLVTITGFTVAHSLTLVLAALDMLRLPVAPIEAVIALSVLFLATELARRETVSLTWRYPVAVSSTFGLLHGLGFAAVLDEIGLPQLQLLTGLIFFNLGVELGQVAFALVVMAILWTLRRGQWLLSYGRLATAYAVGTIAAYWFIDRTVSFVS
ncbi:MAG: HupE/UreJ family protein [Pseudomonadota bacterium]